MAENLLTAPTPGDAAAPPADRLPTDHPSSGRPPHVPEKFWDAEAGGIRVDALLKSYLELERRLSAGTPAPDRGQMLKALGVPDSPDGYCVRCDHGLFAADPGVNGRLHAAGFTPEQAQLVYDLAAERLVPLVQEMAAEFQAEREIERLVAHFGGEDKWRETSRQIFAWASRNLPRPAVEGLSTTYEGVLAMHRMMTGAEPAALKGGGTPAAEGEAELHALMRDPRYWRDRDPAMVARITEGFQRLYPDR